MSKTQMNVTYHKNTTEENERILIKLRGRSKIDNKTPDEWNKLFAKLNDNNNINNNGKKQRKIGKTSTTVSRQDQVTSDSIYGPIEGFRSGYWWGIRMDCSRDQVHSSFDKDIQEGPFGVVSICTSHLNTTNDIDLGSLLTFTGGEYTPETEMNDPLIHNYRNNIPLRLIRSYNLANKFAPKTGYRYDGLYVVISWWIGMSTNSKNYYKFALARLNYQEPLAWSTPSKRSSQRISAVVRSSNTKPGGRCGSLRCHLYGCEIEEPERKKKKMIYNNKISPQMNVSSVRVNKSEVNESTIVMRHVSKKCDTAGAVVGHTMNIRDTESPMQPVDLMLPRSPQLPICKLQSANISIRTELYDSSPNSQQDMKKVTPMTICRIYKTNPVQAARISSQSTSTVGTMNLNSVLGPCNKDKINQESQIQLRSRINKISDTPNVIGTNCILETTKNNCDVETNIITPVSDDTFKNISLECNSINYSELLSKNIKSNNEEMEVLELKSKNNSDNYLPNQIKNSERSLGSSRRSSNSSLSSTEALMKKLQLPEAVVALETMTPEQLLNLIVKKRYNPTANLLIGSIIGFPAENFTKKIENPSKSIDTANCDAPLNSNKELKTTAEICETSIEKLNLHDSKNNFHESRSRTTPTMVVKTIANENIDRRMRFMRLKRSRGAKALVPIEDLNINRNKNSSKRLNKTHINDKVTQPFSKSTTVKKRELANLVIDANFSTILRGHTIQTRRMSRQLKSPTIVLRKRKEFKGFINNYSKVGLSKKNIRLKTGKKTRMSKNRHKQKKKSEETVEKIRRVSAKSIKSDIKTIKEIKRKNSIRQRDKIPIPVNSNKIDRPKSQMVDAMTQCTLQKDALTSIERNSRCGLQGDRMVKIECIDLVDDIKSENEDNELSEDEEMYCDNQISTSNNSKTFKTNVTRKQKKSETNSSVQSNNFKITIANEKFNRMSAFVPVNMPDCELRVARLRSIGFKPIEPCLLQSGETINVRKNDNLAASNKTKSTVIRRNVDEEYNKYTKEENNIVGYMDHELHYQDIEDEASVSQKKNEINSKRKYTKVLGKKLIKNKPSQRTKRKLNTSFEQETNEDNVDEETRPWLGWNSYVTER